MSYDYQIETKLILESPKLHKIFTDNVLCVQNMLNKYKSLFSSYTDHTALHSLEVIAFCNELIGDNIDIINADEIFILLMAAYLHDAGMGISLQDYEEFSKEMPLVQKYIEEHKDACISEVIRTFHNDFSGKYIEKYSFLFDFPSVEYLFSVIQVSRGHRKTDLYDELEYPRELKLPNGNIVHLPYLATLIRLADELDIAADRNLQFLYNISDLSDETSLTEFKKHQSIKRLEFDKDKMIVYVDYSDINIQKDLNELFVKLNNTLSYCVDVTEKCTPFTLFQKHLEIIKL